MLWYEELYLMFLAAPRSFQTQLPDIGLNLSVNSSLDRRSRWGIAVAKLSGHSWETRLAMHQRIREQLRLGVNWLNEFLNSSATARRFQLLTVTQLKELRGSGMSVGAHTVSHPMLSQLPEASAREEIVRSRIALERTLDSPVWALAYPFGDR